MSDGLDLAHARAKIESLLMDNHDLLRTVRDRDAEVERLRALVAYERAERVRLERELVGARATWRRALDQATAETANLRAALTPDAAS